MVLCCAGATKDMGKMLGGEEEKDPDAQKKEEERQEALRQQEEERKAKHARMEAEREKVRQQIRDKVGTHLPCAHPCPQHLGRGWDRELAWPGRRVA